MGWRELLLYFLSLVPTTSLALSVVKQSDKELASKADVVLKARYLTSQCMQIEGQIFTKYAFERLESYLGDVPPHFEIISPGGAFNGLVHHYSGAPSFEKDQNYELYLKEWQDPSGQLQLRLVGEAAGSRVAPEDNPHTRAINQLRETCAGLSHGKQINSFETAISREAMGTGPSAGLLVTNNSGAVVGARRFTAPDRGEPLLVLVDDSLFPSGLTQAQVRASVQSALAVWEAHSSVKMEIVSYQEFPKAVDTYSINEGSFVRIQCHDRFNTIGTATGGRTVGIGGARFLQSINFGDGTSEDAIGRGGIVDGLPFYRSVNGYVIIDHEDPFNNDVDNFTRVLTHEIGHVLGLSHSSDDPAETDLLLKEATMYYTSSGGAGGAVLNAYDTSTIQKVHPLTTPPSGFDRILYAVSKPESYSLINPEVNEVSLLAKQLDTSALTPVLKSSSTLNGQFTLISSTHTLRYTPNFVAASALSEADIVNGFYYDTAEVAFQDSLGNESAPFQVRVVAISPDLYPVGAVDGVPDNWMTTYFGSANGSTASADPDGDSQSNLAEYLAGTSPLDPKAPVINITQFNSNGQLSWDAKLYGVYRLEATSDLGATSWGGFHLSNEGAAGETSSRALENASAATAPAALFYRLIEQR